MSAPFSRSEPRGSVALQAPGRLHLGFLDPGASLGRAYGSLGLVIDGFETRIELSASVTDRVTADTPAGRGECERAAEMLLRLRRLSGRSEPLALRLIEVLPAHVGLGSGTQLALAVGRAFARWHGLEVDTATLAHWMHRGLRSGIGIAGFDQGGLLVDGGPQADGSPAPLLARLAFPDEWRVIVVQDGAQHGLSGTAEKQAIAALPPLARADAAEICHNVLMRVLPGVASVDFAPFAAGITRVQQILGRHYAPVQDGLPYSSAAVARLMAWIGSACGGAAAPVDGAGAAVPGVAIGQSSWGPTGFAILPNQALAEAVVTSAHAAHQVAPQLDIRIVRGLNRGAVIKDWPALQRAG